MAVLLGLLSVQLFVMEPYETHQKVTSKYIPAQTKGYEHHESVPSSTTLYLILVMCLIAVPKHPKRSNKQEEELMLAHSLKS